MDDFGNMLNWSTEYHGWHSLGLYGYSANSGMAVLFDTIDFSEIP